MGLSLYTWVLFIKIQSLEPRGGNEMTKHFVNEQRNWDERLKKHKRNQKPRDKGASISSLASAFHVCGVQWKSKPHITIQAPVGPHLVSFITMKKMYNVVRVFNLGGVWKLNFFNFFFSLNSNDIEVHEVPSNAHYLVYTNMFSGDEQVMRSSRKETLGNANKDVPTLWLLTWVSPKEHWVLCQKEVVVTSSFFKMRE